MTVGLSAASFTRRAIPARFSDSASFIRPVFESRMPRLPWLSDSRRRKSVTAGFSAASFSENATPLGTPPPPPSFGRLGQQNAEVELADCLSAAELKDGGVLRGKLLPDRHRPKVLRLCLLLSARLIQQDAEVAVAACQAAAELGDGGVVRGQLLRDRHRRAVLGLRLLRLARLCQQIAEVDVDVARLGGIR